MSGFWTRHFHTRSMREMRNIPGSGAWRSAVRSIRTASNLPGSRRPAGLRPGAAHRFLIPAKLGKILWSLRKRPEQLIAAVVFNTCRNNSDAEPVAVGPIVARWIAETFKLSPGEQTGDIGVGKADWVDYLRGRCPRKPTRAMIRSTGPPSNGSMTRCARLPMRSMREVLTANSASACRSEAPSRSTGIRFAFAGAGSDRSLIRHELPEPAVAVPAEGERPALRGFEFQLKKEGVRRWARLAVFRSQVEDIGHERMVAEHDVG
jgi:hypothetical protein